MSAIHGRLTTTLLLYTAALVLWSFYLFFRKRELGDSFFGALAIAAVLFTVQFVLGLLLVIQGRAAAVRWVHILYGTVGLITIPALYLYTRGRATYREALAYAVTLLFLVGVVLRASTVA